MVRTLTNQAVYILSMLLAYLIKEFVFHLLGNYKKIHDDPYINVAIGMLIIVAVFYPLYELMKKFGHHLVEEFIKKSQEITNSAFIGLIFGFVILLFGLYCTYAYLWKGISVIKVIHKIIGLF